FAREPMLPRFGGLGGLRGTSSAIRRSKCLRRWAMRDVGADLNGVSWPRQPVTEWILALPRRLLHDSPDCSQSRGFVEILYAPTVLSAPYCEGATPRRASAKFSQRFDSHVDAD